MFVFSGDYKIKRNCQLIPFPSSSWPELVDWRFLGHFRSLKILIFDKSWNLFFLLKPETYFREIFVNQKKFLNEILLICLLMLLIDKIALNTGKWQKTFLRTLWTKMNFFLVNGRILITFLFKDLETQILLILKIWVGCKQEIQKNLT